MTEEPHVHRVDRDGILDALDIRMRPPRVPGKYKIGIFLVASVMVLLPLVYLGLITLTAYGIYWHATENASILRPRRGPLFSYFLPIGVGLVLLFFMVKPFFAPRAPPSGDLELDPEEQPFLFDYVYRLCAAVGAPTPARIIVDCQVNASAGFHQGGTGLFTKSRELRIGLPLVAGMPLRDLTGVLAHEFGHFGQGAGMRLSFVVNAVNHWFARVVHERDAWDEHVKSWGSSRVGYLIALSYTARLFVWVTRRILAGLMGVGRVVSSFMSRQMEYDADRYTVRLVGSVALESSMRRLPQLSCGWQLAIQRLSQHWKEGRLPDDLPRFMIAQTEEMSGELRQQIDRALEEETQHAFDTHPRTVDRISAAEEMDLDGVFSSDEPATVVFDNFGPVCAEATRAHYRSVLGKHFSPSQLASTAEFLGEQVQQPKDQEAQNQADP